MSRNLVSILQTGLICGACSGSTAVASWREDGCAWRAGLEIEPNG